MSIDKTSLETKLDEANYLASVIWQYEGLPDYDEIEARLSQLNSELDEKIVVYKVTAGNPMWDFVYFCSYIALVGYIQTCVEAVVLEKIYVGEQRIVEIEVVQVTKRDLAETPIYEPQTARLSILYTHWHTLPATPLNTIKLKTIQKSDRM